MISEVGYRGMTKAVVGLATVLAVVLSLLAISSTAEARSRQLLTGFGDEAYRSDSPKQRAQAFKLTDSVNGRIVRLAVDWRCIAPQERPAHFEPTRSRRSGLRLVSARRPGSPGLESGVRVMLLVQFAPAWAEGKHRPKSANRGAGSRARASSPTSRRPSRGATPGTTGACRTSGTSSAGARRTCGSGLTPLWGGKNGKKPVAPTTTRRCSTPSTTRSRRSAPRTPSSPRSWLPTAPSPGWSTCGRCVLAHRAVRQGQQAAELDQALQEAEVRCPRAQSDHTTAAPAQRAAIRTTSRRPTCTTSSTCCAPRRSATTPSARPQPVWATELWWETNPPDPQRSTRT